MTLLNLRWQVQQPLTKNLRNIITISVLLWASSCFASIIDRKIIIEDGTYHCVSIDPLFQIGTYHYGSIDDTLLTSNSLALPAGRMLGGNENELAWDIAGKDIFAVSTLEHPLNDRYEAIKKIPVDSMKAWNNYNHQGDVILISVDNYMYAPNEPYKYIASRFKSLDTYYFDAVYFKDKLWMVVTCQNEWTVWYFENYEWKQSSVLVPYQSCKFTLFEKDDEMHMVMESSAVYKVTEKKIEQLQVAKAQKTLNDGIVIQNKDANTLMYLDKTHLDKQKPLSEIISEFSTILYE